MGRALFSVIVICLAVPSGSPALADEREAELLDRGTIAVRCDGGVFVGWRMLASDPAAVAFNVYRESPGASPVRLNDTPIVDSTNVVDDDPPTAAGLRYFVCAIVGGDELPGDGVKPIRIDGPYLSVPLQTPDGYTPNDAAIGDLDGDGRYEVVVKQVLRGFDNSQRGVCPGTTKLEAYTLDGELLWRIDLGPNIREGAHYTPFLVCDFDGCGRAEIAVRTAEGTVDGTGRRIGDTDGDGRTHYVNPETGYILEGPEFISVFDGRTGREIAREPYIARGNVADWGDAYGNRVDRFLMAVAYCDGARPSIVLCRGYYALTKLEAWSFRDGKLAKQWAFSSEGHPGYAGQGNHNLAVADVDDDRRDEIIYGSMALDDDGSPLHTTRLGHGDAIHLSDIDPSSPGLEVFQCHEEPGPAGIELRSAATGERLWGAGAGGDVGRAVAMDIDPRTPGYECWGAGGGMHGLYDCRGNRLADSAPRSCNMGVWWDADPLRELLDGTKIDKWNYADHATTRLLSAHEYGCASNNGTKRNPAFCGDIFGDWREEVIWRTDDNRELRIFTTTIPTDLRMPTLMQDHAYRMSAATQNVGYNQPTQPGFYLGHGMPGARNEHEPLPKETKR